MSGLRSSHHAAPSVEDAASAWVLEERAGLDLHRSLALDAWLAAGDDHAQAFDRAHAALDAVERQGADLEMVAMREAALRARPDRVAPPLARIAAGLAALAIVGAGGWWATSRTPEGHGLPTTQPVSADAATARYETAVGERSTVVLPDGSTVSLNTATTIQVAYSDDERAIHLLAGQALFSVAHGRATPFRVYAGERVVTATGTAFEVYLEGERVRVAMLEGSVKVAPRSGRSGAPSPPVEDLSAGEVLIASPGAPTRIRLDDVERLSGWRTGQVVFDDMPLSEAVQEINRYTTRPLTLADAAAGRQRISGAFRAGEPERFARTVSEVLPLEIKSSADGRIVLATRSP